MMGRRMNRIGIDKYFNIANNIASCKLCSHTLKSNRCFNLKTHAIKVHQIKKEEFLIGKTSSVCVPVNTNTTSTGIITKKLKKQTFKIELNKKQLFRSYIGLVTENSIPFQILDSENFKNIIDPICRGFNVKFNKNISLNSSKCIQVLQEVSDNIRNAIKTELNQRLVSIKIDSAGGLSGNVFGVSVQFIKNNQIQSHILGMVELKGIGPSSLKNLSMDILSILTKYSINLNQIVSITSDNEANNMIFEDARNKHNTDDGNDIYFDNIQIYEGSSDIQLGDIQICRCASHAAQLCALDVSKDPEIKKLLFNCRNLVKYINNPSNGFRDKFVNKNLTIPQLDCPTKWGSTYNMIRFLKNAKNILFRIQPIKNESIDENFESNDSFWYNVEAYCIAFEPLHNTMVKFQLEPLHYGNFYAEWLKCKIITAKTIEKSDKTYVKIIGTSLVLSMEIMTSKLLNNEILISCLYLDPRFNHTLTLIQKLEASVYLKKLYERIKIINMHTSAPKNKIEFPSSSFENNQFSEEGDDYLNEYLTQNFMPTKKECSDIDACTKIENLQLPFLRVDSNVLHFWRDKQHSDPELYALSSICFAVPTTQVTIEPAFSSVKHIMRDNPNPIGQDTVENILLVKLNAEYLDKAIEDLPLFENVA